MILLIVSMNLLDVFEDAKWQIVHFSLEIFTGHIGKINNLYFINNKTSEN